MSLDFTRRTFLKTTGMLSGSSLLGAVGTAAASRTDPFSADPQRTGATAQSIGTASDSLALFPTLELAPSKWIWYPERRPLPNTFVFFRKELILNGAVLSARGRIAADSRYRLFVNGKLVQRGPAPFDPRFQEFDPVELTPYLSQGVNCIGLLVCFWGAHGEGTYIPGKPGVQFALAVETETGRHTLSTDGQWRTKRADCWPAGLYRRSFLRAMQEVFDARRYPEGWSSAGFDDSSWKQAKELDLDSALPLILAGSKNYSDLLAYCPGKEDASSFHMRFRSIPFLSEKRFSCAVLLAEGALRWNAPPEEYFDAYTENAFETQVREKPQASANGAPFPLKASLQTEVSQVFLLSLGEEMVGYPFVRVRAPSGTAVELVFGEYREPDSPLLPSHCWPGNAVRLVTHDGVTEFEAFDWEAVKELAVLVRGSGTAEILDAGVTRIRAPFPRVPDFQCSDADINRIHAAGVNTCVNISQECMCDNPTRERQQYAGEVGLNYLSHYLAFGEYRLARRYLLTWADGQSEDGWFLDCYPAIDRLQRLWQTHLHLSHWGPIVDHALSYLFHVYWYVLYSGDLSVVGELKPRLIKHANWLDRVRDEEGLLPVELGMHTVWIDHNGFRNQRQKQAALNVWYYGYLTHAMLPLAELDGDEAWSGMLRRRADALKRSIFARFRDPSTGVLVDNLPWRAPDEAPAYHDRTLSMGLLFGLLEGKAAETALKMLEECPKGRPITEQIPNGLGLSHPPYAGWRLMAMARAGLGEAILDDLRQRWGNMPSLRANNTFSENWTGGAKCQCSTAPVYILYGEILGIKPLKPGFSRYTVSPKPGFLSALRGSVLTPLGSVRLDYQVKNSLRTLRLELPAKGEAVIRLPQPPKKVTVDGKRFEVADNAKEIRFSPEKKSLVEIEWLGCAQGLTGAVGAKS